MVYNGKPYPHLPVTYIFGTSGSSYLIYWQLGAWFQIYWLMIQPLSDQQFSADLVVCPTMKMRRVFWIRLCQWFKRDFWTVEGPEIGCGAHYRWWYLYQKVKPALFVDLHFIHFKEKKTHTHTHTILYNDTYVWYTYTINLLPWQIRF